MTRKTLLHCIWLATVLTLLPVFSTHCQDFVIPIVIRDNGSGFDTLRFGYHRCATRCIDRILGEQELPPAPPAGVFDIRWADPVASPNPDCIGQGLKLNLHTWNVFDVFTDTFKVVFQPSAEGGFPMHFSWPAGLTTMFSSLSLKDPFGGVLVNVDMLANTSLEVTNSAFSNLLIYVSGPVWIQTLSDPCDPVGIVETPLGLPGSFLLHQNYPNPFNPSTTIQFDIPTPAFVELEVYDISGRIVRHLTARDLQPGTYTATWDGMDNAGNDVASGVYYIRMQATTQNASVYPEQFTSIQNVVLAR